MDRDAIESEIGLLDMRVREIAALVAQQQRVIATLGAIGRDTKAAKHALAELLAAQRLREAELAVLRKKLSWLERRPAE
jgi:hypothetical protein